ncbi:MAG: thiol:disulfide interchange protein DsbA/DsbL [Rhodanobacteraceae bacterium]
MLRSVSILLAALACAGIANAQGFNATAPAQRWQAGTNYTLIDPPQPTATGDKIEVLEIFSYACPHCAHFQPYADELKASLPPYAEFGNMPAVFNASWEPFARAYYTAQSLGVAKKTHQALFDALHRDHEPLRTIEDLSTFYAKHGVDPKKFIAASNSFEVNSKLMRAERMVKAYGVRGTPSIVVNGKYLVTGQSAGGYPQLIELVDWLVRKEHDATQSSHTK